MKEYKVGHWTTVGGVSWIEADSPEEAEEKMEKLMDEGKDEPHKITHRETQIFEVEES